MLKETKKRLEQKGKVTITILIFDPGDGTEIDGFVLFKTTVAFYSPST